MTQIRMGSSNHKEMEKNLYSFILENASDFVIVLNDKFEIEYVNERTVFRGFGYKKEDLVGKMCVEFIHPEDREKSLILLSTGFAKGEGTGEIRLKHKDGKWIWTEINGKTFLDNDETTKGVLIARDITVRKDVEEKLNRLNKELKQKIDQSNEKLKKSEEKYRNLIENSPFAIALISSKGIITECNFTVEKLLGYKKEEMIGNYFSDYSDTLRNNLPFLFIQFKNNLKREDTPFSDIQLIKKDGNKIWINMQTSLVKIRNKIFLQVIFYDITERKRAESLITEEVEKIEELEKIRKELISSVSHELKTPLMSVSGASELLMNVFEDQIDSEISELLHIIERGTKRLEKLVERFLDISKLDFKKLSLHDQACDVSEVIQECANEMKYLLKRREIMLNLELVEEFTISIDKLRLEQVIMSVLSNSIKNTPPRGTINLSLEVGREYLRIIVSDTGIGFTPKELEKVQQFSRFCKIQRQGSGTEYLDIQGTGLGLFISKKIIDMYNGRISIDSKGRNKGCKCIIELPKTKNKNYQE